MNDQGQVSSSQNAKSSMAMMVKAKQSQVSGVQRAKRVPSNSASHEKIKVTRGATKDSSERSPNRLSSQDARSIKAANKSFQFGHQTQLMSCSSGGESSTNQAKNRSLSGKAGGPQIKIKQNVGELPQQYFIAMNLQFQQPGTTTAQMKTHLDDSQSNQLQLNSRLILPATTQNNQDTTTKTFCFTKEELNQKKKIELQQKTDQQQKHTNLISLKNVKGGANSTSQDSKTREPYNITEVTKLQQTTQNEHKNIIGSHSPTPQSMKIEIKNQVKNIITNNENTDQKGKYQLPEDQRTIKLQTKETAQSYLIPIHSGLHSVKSATNKSTVSKSQSKPPAPTDQKLVKQLDDKNLQQNQKLIEKVDLKGIVVELKDKKSEIIKIITNLSQNQDQAHQINQNEQVQVNRDRRERSKERIQETIKSLEKKLDNFSQMMYQNTQQIKQIAYLQRQQSNSRQSNFSINDPDEEKKTSNTPQPRNWVDNQCVDFVTNLPNIDKSAKLLLVINEQPRLSLFSEGLNSLVTVDEYLMTTHQVSANVPGSSDGPQTMRQISKGSLEGPGGTQDDLSIISLSEIIADDHLEMYVGFQTTTKYNRVKDLDEHLDDQQNVNNDDILTLADVVLEEKDDQINKSERRITSDQQSKKFKEVFVQYQAENEQSHLKIVQLSKSQKLTKEEIIGNFGFQKQKNEFELGQQNRIESQPSQSILITSQKSKFTEEKQSNFQKFEQNSRETSSIMPEKPTNLSANSAEISLDNQLNFRSLERIRQESGGSQIISKKIGLFKNQFKFKACAPAVITGAISDKQDATSIQVINKKTLALIKQHLGTNPGPVAYISNDIIVGPDDSCEISGIINSSDTQSSNAARGFSSLVGLMPQRVENNTKNEQSKTIMTTVGIKSSGSISPFQGKLRIQQRSNEREYLSKAAQSKNEIETSLQNNIVSSVDLSQSLINNIGCATPQSLPTGKILISKQKFQTALGQNKSPDDHSTILINSQTPHQKTTHASTSISASQLQELMPNQLQQVRKEKKLQILVKQPMGGSGETATMDLLQNNKLRLVKSQNRNANQAKED